MLSCYMQVNVASRMESTGISGSIQVSADYAAEVNPWLDMQDRGYIEVKGKGMMRAYILHVSTPISIYMHALADTCGYANATPNVGDDCSLQGLRSSRAMDLQKHLTAQGVYVRQDRKLQRDESMTDAETACASNSKRNTLLRNTSTPVWSPFSTGMSRFDLAEPRPDHSKPHVEDVGNGDGHQHQAEDDGQLECHVLHLLTPAGILKDLQACPSPAAATDTAGKGTNVNRLAESSLQLGDSSTSTTLCSTTHGAPAGDNPPNPSRVLAESTPQKSAKVLSPLDLLPRGSSSERTGQPSPPGVPPSSQPDNVSPAVPPRETQPTLSDPPYVSDEAARWQSATEEESAKMDRFTFFSNFFKLGFWRPPSVDDVTLIQAPDPAGTSIPPASALQAWHRTLSCSDSSLDSVVDVQRPIIPDTKEPPHALHEPWRKRRPQLSNLRRSLFGPFKN